MANIRQYIGARYVIKIYENSQNPSSAEWEQGNFEPLVMVTWQNGSYLSKKEVPATVGNPASNPSYWVQTGFYNGQIASLQGQIDDINNNKLPAVTSAIQTLTNNFNSIPTKRRYILIGDSYGYGISPDYTSETGKGWIDWFADTVGDINDVYFADVSVLQGVAGFASSMSFLSMLQTLDSVITNKDTITDIVVMGGANDVAWNNVTKTAIENAIESFCAYCNTNYPNAHVKIGVLCASLNLMLNDTADTYNAYRSCTLHGAEFIDDALNAYVAPAYISSDGTHLTQSGYEHYAPVTNNLIISGHADYVEDFVVGLTLDNTLISLSDQQTTKINLTGRISADNIILNMRNQQNNSCAFRILDRSISYAASIASAFTLDTAFNLPLYNEISGGNIYIRQPNNSNECNIGGAFRIFQNASDKLTVQLSSPIGNWHVNDSDYQMICVIECSHVCIIPY